MYNVLLPCFQSEPMENCVQMNEKFNVKWNITGEEITFEFNGALGWYEDF